MKVELLHNTPLHIAAHGARTCWDSGDKSDTKTELMSCATCGDGKDIIECGPKDMELIDRVGNKFKHASILEHVSYNFHISGVSRALLQELARHRIASLSVKSTRYTLKELKDEPAFTDINIDKPRASKFVVFTGENMIDYFILVALDNLRKLLTLGGSNDKIKYALPEAYKTELTWTVNIRSLQNFISLRSDKSALWEIRDLANAIYEALPEEHKYLFQNHLKEINE